MFSKKFAMPIKRIVCAIICCWLISTNVVAHTVQAIVGWTKPPYVIEATSSGFELELIREVFRLANINIHFNYVPHGRLATLLEKGAADIALTINPRQKPQGMVLSAPYIQYQNAVISLKSMNIDVSKLEDVSDKSVVAFQNATKVLGAEYAAAVAENTSYLEVPLQSRQVELLMNKRTDMVVMDINIFNYLSRNIAGKSFMDSIHVNYYFPATNYHLGCTSEQLCEVFNRHYQLFIQSDLYLQLINKYQFIQR
ncbi:substrate-binding periplasmic protein [Thalassotalea fusca]